MGTSQILGIYALIAAALVVLRYFANTLVGRIAFSWMGPVQVQGESWAKYQWRWFVYSFDCLTQIAVLFVLLNCAFVFLPETQEHQLLWAFQFALALGGGMAILACVGFLVKAAKAQYLGPNPTCEVQQVSPDERKIDV